MARTISPLETLTRKHRDAIRCVARHERALAKLETRLAGLRAQIEAMGGFPKRRRLIDISTTRNMQRTLFETGRERESFTAADLAAVMLERCGLADANPATVFAMRQRCIACIKRCERKGLVRAVGWSDGKHGRRGRLKRWGLQNHSHFG